MVWAERELEVVILCRRLPGEIGGIKADRKLGQAKALDDFFGETRRIGMLSLGSGSAGGTQAFFLTESTISSTISLAGAWMSSASSIRVGKAEIMDTFEKAVVSSTFSGETLSLAAAKASLLTYKQFDVIGHIKTLIRRHNFSAINSKMSNTSFFFCFCNIEIISSSTN